MLTSAAYHIRDLNTEVEDDEGIVSLPNNAGVGLMEVYANGVVDFVSGSSNTVSFDGVVISL